MEIRAAIEGKLEDILKQERKIASKAVTLSVRRVSTNLKNQMRRQVKSAKLGERLAKTWRSESYPERGYSLGAAAYIYSKAKYMSAFEDGAIIRARNAKWLAIPTENAGYKGRRRAKPSDFQAGALQFVAEKDGKSARLVYRPKGGGAEITYFILVRQSKLKKLINFKEASEKAADSLPETILREWEKAEQ